MANFVTKVPAYSGLYSKSGAMLFNIEPKIINSVALQVALSAMHDRWNIRSLATEKTAAMSEAMSIIFVRH